MLHHHNQSGRQDGIGVSELLIELLNRLEQDHGRGQMAINGPNYYKDHRKRFKKLREGLKNEDEAPANRYVLTGVDGDTQDLSGNTVTVHENFVIVRQQQGGISLADLKEIKEKTGLDVVLVPVGVELQVLKVINPKG